MHALHTVSMPCVHDLSLCVATDRQTDTVFVRPPKASKLQFNFIHDDLMRCNECASLCWQIFGSSWLSYSPIRASDFVYFRMTKELDQIRSLQCLQRRCVCGDSTHKRLPQFNLIQFFGWFLCVVGRVIDTWLVFIIANAFNFTDNHLNRLSPHSARHLLLIVESGNYGLEWANASALNVGRKWYGDNRREPTQKYGNRFRIKSNNIHRDGKEVSFDSTFSPIRRLSSLPFTSLLNPFSIFSLSRICIKRAIGIQVCKFRHHHHKNVTLQTSGSHARFECAQRSHSLAHAHNDDDAIHQIKSTVKF